VSFVINVEFKLKRNKSAARVAIEELPLLEETVDYLDVSTLFALCDSSRN
jgi:hypothetical protein